MSMNSVPPSQVIVMKILRNASLPSSRSILSRTSTVLLPFASGIFLAISLRLFLSVIVKRHAVDESFPPFTVSSSQCPKFSRSSTSFGRLSMLYSAHFARLKFFLEPFSLYFSPLLGKSVLETPGISPPFTQLYNVFSTARVSLGQPFIFSSASVAYGLYFLSTM